MSEQAVGDGLDGRKVFGRGGVGLLEVMISLVCYLGLSVAAGVALFAAGYDVTSEGSTVTLWLSDSSTA